MASSGGASSSLPKWQLALVVGAPVALGLGYMYYKSSINKPEEKPGEGKSKKSVKENGKKQISIDGDFPTKSEHATSDKSPSVVARKYKEEGNKWFNKGRFDEAIAHYNLAIETIPKENKEELATFYQNRAAAYEKLKKFSAVRADCTTALELNPKYVKALIRRARAMESSNDLETALEDITAACMLEKYENLNSINTMDKVLKQLGKQRAQEYIANKKPNIMPSKHFISTYFLAFHNDPIMSKMDELSAEENTPFNKVLQNLNKQEYDDIIPLCNEELNNLGSDDNSLHKMRVLLLRGTFHLLIAQYEDALSDFSTVINSDVASKELKVNALIKRASMHIQLEDHIKCLTDFEEAIKFDPECGDIYHNRGQVLLLMEQFDIAKADFEKAVELNPGFSVAYVQKCYADYRYAVSERDVILMDASMTNFDKAFEKFPDCSECYCLYAQMLIDIQNYAKADSYLVEASKIDPNNASILVYRGLLQLRWKNDTEKTIKYVKEAIILDDKCEFAYEILGTLEVQRGNLTEAMSLFDKAVRLSCTTSQLAHIFGLRDATKAACKVSERLGLDVMKSLREISLY